MTVFDSSALLAYVLSETGGDVVEQRLIAGGVISAASWSEVAQKLQASGAWPEARDLLLSFPVRLEPVGREDAEVAATLWSTASNRSLGDRLCLALGMRLDAEVTTADRAWSGRPGVVLIR